MAQGAVKKSKPTTSSTRKCVPFPNPRPAKRSFLTCAAYGNNRPSKSGPRPGARVIKPKKASLIAQNKIKHKSSCGLVGQTEKLLAQKAGHLEILKGGKADRKDKRDGGQGKAGK